MDWGIVVICVTANICAAFVWAFRLWVSFQRSMKEDYYHFKKRAFDLEEKKFEVWKTAQLAHIAQHGEYARRLVNRVMRDFSSISPKEMEPSGGNVIPFNPMRLVNVEMEKTVTGARDGDEEPPEMSEERMREIAELLEQAKDMDEDEARAFLAEHGLHDVTIFRSDS